MSKKVALVGSAYTCQTYILDHQSDGNQYYYVSRLDAYAGLRVDKVLAIGLLTEAQWELYHIIEREVVASHG